MYLLNMLDLNNSSINIYNTSSFLKLDIQKPEIQRILETNKVDSIIEYQLDFYKKYGHFNFGVSGPINIHIIEDKILLVDGQHRYKALERLFKEHGHDIDFYVETVKVNSLDELKENYSMINKNTPLPDFTKFSPENKSVIEAVAEEFQVDYKNIWSKGTTRSKRPFMNFNTFQEAIGYIFENTNVKTANYVKKLVTDYNDRLSKWELTSSQFPSKTSLAMYNKAKEYKIYLGLYPIIDDDYRYEWAKKIVEEQTGRIIKKKTKKNKKEKIPKKVKNDSWDKYIGSELGEAICICCRETKIKSKDFIAGHIISENNGGQITVDNILPICNLCNSSMGTKNMDDFIKKYYPDNYDRFLRRDYKNKDDSILSQIINPFKINVF